MKIDRADFLGKLRLLKPALADKSPVEGLNNIWFDGVTATAFNDIVGIEVPCDAPIAGGLMGGTLLGLLENSAAKEVTLTPDPGEGTNMVLTSAGSKARIPMKPPDQAVFEMPSSDVENSDFQAVRLSQAFLDALKHVMASISGAGDNMGVTLIHEPISVVLYATDAMTIAWARLSVDVQAWETAQRVVISPLFCAQFLVLCKEGDSLIVTDDFAMAVTSEGVRLFGRLVDVQKEHDFAGAIAENVPKNAKGVALPQRLGPMLDRAEVLVAGVARVPVKMSVDADVLRLSLNGDLGDLNEAVKLEKPFPKPQAGMFNSALIRRVLERSERFLISPQCFVLLGAGDSGYLVSASAD